MADFGYDVSDYCDVDPLFGTLDDFDRMLAVAHDQGLKVIIDMAKLRVPFQFNCSVATRKRIRENPDEARRLVWSMAEAGWYYKTHKEESIKIAQKYTRGVNRAVLDAARRCGFGTESA